MLFDNVEIQPILSLKLSLIFRVCSCGSLQARHTAGNSIYSSFLDYFVGYN